MIERSAGYFNNFAMISAKQTGGIYEKILAYNEKHTGCVSCLAFLYIILGPKVHPARVQSKKKSCKATMEDIASKIEIYFQEFEFSNSAPQYSELLKKGYFKSRPFCPSIPDRNYFTHAVKMPDGKIFADVECQHHGLLSLQETADKKKEKIKLQ